MKKNHWITALLGVTLAAFGQQTDAGETPACDCPSCREKADSGKEFTLPGLQGLEDDHPAGPTQNDHEDARR